MDIKTLNNIEITTDAPYKDLLKDCYNYASKSNHPSTHTAALLVNNGKVILRGKNIFPQGVKYTKKRVYWEQQAYISKSCRKRFDIQSC